MESRLPAIAKKVWSLVRAMFFMLKKGIAKRKFLLDLHMMMKHDKIAGKALHNLMFQRHHNWTASALHRHPQHLSFATSPLGEYEFSCNDTPLYPLSLFSKKHHNKRHRLATTNPSLAAVDNCDDIITDHRFWKALDIMITNSTLSPQLSGSRNTVMVDPLRIKESPLVFNDHAGSKDGQVDKAAERFIMRFYNDRRRENELRG